jgi:hypothetical protein
LKQFHEEDCDRIFEEKLTGENIERQLQELLYLGDG